jgi:peptidoglycan/LPS O-acetylase OafA/YrhL
MSYSYYLIHGLTLHALLVVLTYWLPPTGSNPVLFWVFLPCAFAATLVSATVLFTLYAGRLRSSRSVGILIREERLSPVA